MKLIRLLVLAVGLSMGTTWAFGANTTFDVKSPPTKAEWQHFNKMNQGQLLRLWQYQVTLGNKTLESWAWQWRLGWIRHCTRDNLTQICPKILADGLTDDAMVVRAEAASAYGIIYRGRPNPNIIKSLAEAFTDPRNVRHGSPLFVCDRILATLHNIGGELAERNATQLANKYPATAEYWAKVRKQSL